MTHTAGASISQEVVGRASKLTRVRDVAAREDGRGYWIVKTSSKSVDPESLYDFEDIVLKSGDVLHLVYTEDRDDDGLGAREEFLYGTDEDEADTDGDGLTDYEEVREGWELADSGEQVFSDPRSADVDEDGVADDVERDLGTDPYRANGDDGSDGSDGDDSGDGDDIDLPTPYVAADFHGTLGELEAHEGDFTEDRFGELASAWDLTADGLSIYQPLLTAGHVDVSETFSLAIWVKSDGSISDQRIMGQEGWLALRMDGDRAAFGPYAGDGPHGPQVVSDTPHEDGVWTQYVVVVERTSSVSSRIALYQDGARVGSAEVGDDQRRRPRDGPRPLTDPKVDKALRARAGRLPLKAAESPR